MEGTSLARIPAHHARTSESESTARCTEQRLRKRPEALDLPDDVTTSAQRSWRSARSRMTWDCCTVSRHHSVSCHCDEAAAVGGERPPPHRCSKASIRELDVLNKAPGTSRMKQNAWLQDADKVVAQAERVAQIATTAQTAGSTPTWIQASCAPSIWPDLASRGFPPLTSI